MVPNPELYPAIELWTCGKMHRNLRESPTGFSVSAHMYPTVKEVTMETDNFHVVYPKAAGIDVHKMQLTVSLSLCGDNVPPQTKTRVFSALADGLSEMTQWLGENDVEAAVMEGTGIYWITPFEALEDAGIKPLLVNARQVKQLRGRKTDVADSVWLARVCQFGLCSPSHVPPKVFRELRAMNRHRRKLVNQRSSVRNRVQKVIDRGGNKNRRCSLRRVRDERTPYSRGSCKRRGERRDNRFA